jgi:hypothetical protein
MRRVLSSRAVTTALFVAGGSISGSFMTTAASPSSSSAASVSSVALAAASGVPVTAVPVGRVGETVLTSARGIFSNTLCLSVHRASCVVAVFFQTLSV